MGTRSITIIEDEDAKPILTLYRQFDGYPEGHGRQLAQFLNGFKVCNGIGDYSAKKVANGANCLAAQVVAHFKRARKSFDGKRQGPVGNFYLYPGATTDIGEEYVYRVAVSAEHGITLNVWNAWQKAEIMRGTPAEIMRAIRNTLRRRKAVKA